MAEYDAELSVTDLWILLKADVTCLQLGHQEKRSEILQACRWDRNQL